MKSEEKNTTGHINTYLALNAPVCGRSIGTQSVKVLLVRMCLCLVGTHEFMSSCMNIYGCVLLVRVCNCWAGTNATIVEYCEVPTASHEKWKTPRDERGVAKWIITNVAYFTSICSELG